MGGNINWWNDNKFLYHIVVSEIIWMSTFLILNFHECDIIKGFLKWKILQISDPDQLQFKQIVSNSTTKIPVL